ncbi:hypothetical protein ES705_38436 [subsurface metagenome]
MICLTKPSLIRDSIFCIPSRFKSFPDIPSSFIISTLPKLCSFTYCIILSSWTLRDKPSLACSSVETRQYPTNLINSLLLSDLFILPPFNSVYDIHFLNTVKLIPLNFKYPCPPEQKGEQGPAIRELWRESGSPD